MAEANSSSERVSELIDVVGLVHAEHPERLDYSYYNPAGWKIRFDFSFRDYMQSLDRYLHHWTVDDHLPVVVHEHFHFFQYAYTTFGYYNHLIRHFKVALMQGLARHVMERTGLDKLPTLSLYQLVKAHESQLDNDYTTRLLFAWIEAELVDLYLNPPNSEPYSLNPELSAYLERFQHAHLLRSDVAMFASHFWALERDLCWYLGATDRVDAQTSSRNRSSVIESYSPQEVEAEKLNISNKSLGVIPGLRGLLESFSTAGELMLGGAHLDIGSFVASETSADLVDYHLPLQIAAQMWSIRDPVCFLNTYLSICDIALNPPMLPNLAAVRRGTVVESADPAFRFWKLLGSVPRLSPVKDLQGDYYRFSGEICDMLGWPTPEVTNACLLQTNELERTEDVPSKLFWEFQRLRNAHGVGVYLDVGTLLTRLAEELTLSPLTQFSDEILFNRSIHEEPSQVEVEIALQCLNNQFWVDLFRRFPRKLQLPYPLEPTLRRQFEKYFRELNASLGFELDASAVTVENPTS